MPGNVNKPVIGWREWLVLPQLAETRIKAKIDTGARTSALHAHALEVFRRQGRHFARFAIHPIQRKAKPQVVVEAPIIDHRPVRSSSGVASLRYVIETEVALLGRCWVIELTLVNRDAMGFRMLLGRQALRRRFVVDPGRSYANGKPPNLKSFRLES